MKFYLSSFRIGDKTSAFKALFNGSSKKVAYISNALDSVDKTRPNLVAHMQEDIGQLTGLGLEVETLDLRNYFNNQKALEDKLNELDGVWISGGNVFVLRQAMKLSGFDEIIVNKHKNKSKFVYAGYSAACCVLSPTLDAYQIVDDATALPYSELSEVIWKGLGLIDFVYLPHFDSDHSESGEINKELQYCLEKHLKYQTFKDGDVLII